MKGFFPLSRLRGEVGFTDFACLERISLTLKHFPTLPWQGIARRKTL
jgi:hypothetical protein